MKMIVKRVILTLKPSEKLKKPRLTLTVSKPTLSALKKKFFTGPFGKTPDKRYDSAEPIIPPITTPNSMFPTFLLAISPPLKMGIRYWVLILEYIYHPASLPKPWFH